MDQEAAKKKKPAKKVTPKKDPDRKPDYDDNDLPKILKGPVAPELKKEYDVPVMGPGCGCGGPVMPSGILEPIGPGPDAIVPPGAMVESPLVGSPVMLLECPSCHQRAPLEFDLPVGQPIERLALECFGCGEKIPFGKIMNNGNGIYAVAS